MCFDWDYYNWKKEMGMIGGLKNIVFDYHEDSFRCIYCNATEKRDDTDNNLLFQRSHKCPSGCEDCDYLELLRLAHFSDCFGCVCKEAVDDNPDTRQCYVNPKESFYFMPIIDVGNLTDGSDGTITVTHIEPPGFCPGG